MADQNRSKDRDRSTETNAVVPETSPGTTRDEDFGKSDRYANKDDSEAFNVRTMGDGTAWDSGREAAITDGTRTESGTRAADAETPGVPTRRSGDALDE